MIKAVRYLQWWIIFPLTFSLPFVSNQPKHIELPEVWKQVSEMVPVFAFSGYAPGSKIEHELYLLSDNRLRPLLFYSPIITPVCIDAVCKPLYIDIYWDLVGEYVGFGLDTSHMLTKFDHELFADQDYTKLHRLLGDKHSALDRKDLSELFDPTIAAKKSVEFNGHEVDAVSGATVLEIKESVVEGALYSCYTLWKIVHGDVQNKIRAQLKENLNDEILQYLLNSSLEHYQLFAIRNMEPNIMIQYRDEVLNMYTDGTPLLKTYILKKIPDSFFRRKKLARVLYDDFQLQDMSSKTLLLQKLSLVHHSIFSPLIDQIPSMSRKQLLVFLEALAEIDRSREQIRAMLGASQSNEYPYAYLIEDWCREFCE